MAKEEFSAFLGTSTVYQGQLSFSGAVRIDGKFIGEITSEDTLILGKDAKVEGKIHVNQLVLSGHVNGEIVVTGRTTLHKSAVLLGSLTTRAIIMEEGAILQGKVIMQPEQPETAAAASAGSYAAADDEELIPTTTTQ